MDSYSHPVRKIDPNRMRPDGTPDDDNRIEIGPTPLAFGEWAEAGLVAPNLDAMRRYRLERLRAELVARDWGGVLMFDPLNIRYATDTTNMQLWNAHNPFRAALVCADGHMVLWDYVRSPFLADFNPLVAEVRSGASMFYFANGDRTVEAAERFAAEVADVLRARVGGNRRLGVDKIQIAGLRSLEGQGLCIELGEALTERARSIKGPDEILAMRCAMHACERSVEAMEAAAAPGLTEDDIWAVLHAENIRRGGEWIETRLLTSGPRTNPWFQECGPRVVRDGEILGLDTDMVGCYGMCADISRTFWIGAPEPRSDMIEDYRLAVEHIEVNMEMLRPGLALGDWIARSHRLPDVYQAQKYSCLAHGVGLCDEWPIVCYPEEHVAGAFEIELAVGMCLCVEALVSREGGDFSIKLEDQVVITEAGFENITRYPWDRRLMGE